MPYLFTSESVSAGHPDKVADQLSDAVLDAILAHEPNAKVACETFVTTGLAIVGGEIKISPETKAKLDITSIVRNTIDKIGYNKAEYMFEAHSCGILNCLHDQSPEINQGVERGGDIADQGAGDQGIMFGYACNETDNYMPLTLELSHLLLQELHSIRDEKKIMKYLRPDAKAQVSIEYSDNHKPLKIVTIVISTQHDDFVKTGNKVADEAAMQEKITQDIIKHLIPRVKKLMPARVAKMMDVNKIQFLINPTGVFVIGGPHGDTGLTGRKIIVDTYGGRGAHGGGAFSGKDPSKVDRSAAYAARHIAKNLVAAGVADQILVQVAYAIGVAQPVGIYLSTNGTAKVRNEDGKKMSDNEISSTIEGIFDMRPGAIIERLKLKNPIYSETAAYGHMGQKAGTKTLMIDGKEKHFQTFTWEKLDYVDQIQKLFNILAKEEVAA
ncbi:MAG: methionine adenosyltransferase [Bacteroidota bacterium]|nr:methionine adenosyltransferase [Bacteroidota bacterium]